jgi:hypothetical protein
MSVHLCTNWFVHLWSLHLYLHMLSELLFICQDPAWASLGSFHTVCILKNISSL